MNDTNEQVFLGLDYGGRRLGVARSDPTGLIASPVTTLTVSSDTDALTKLVPLLSETRPAGIVLGYPIHASGDKSPKCLEIDAFIKRLKKIYDGPVFTQDERYSSAEAASVLHAHGKKTGKRKERIDRIAAVIILQRFLDERRSESR